MPAQMSFGLGGGPFGDQNYLGGGISSSSQPLGQWAVLDNRPCHSTMIGYPARKPPHDFLASNSELVDYTISWRVKLGGVELVGGTVVVPANTAVPPLDPWENAGFDWAAGTYTLEFMFEEGSPIEPEYPDADYTDKIVVEVGNIRGYPISYSNIPNTQQYGPFYVGALFQVGALVSLDGRPLRWGVYVLKSADGTIVLAEATVASFQTRAPFLFLPPQFCANIYTTFVLTFAEDPAAPEPPHPPGSGGDPSPYTPGDPPNDPEKPSAPAAGSCTCHDQLVYLAECILYHADIMEDRLNDIRRQLEYPAPSNDQRRISVAEGLCHNLQGTGWLR